MNNFILQFFDKIAFIVGLVGGVIGIAMALQDFNKWYLASYGICATILASVLFYALCERINMLRMRNFQISRYLKIFENTHNSWHMYKRLIDTIGEDEKLELDDLLALLRKNISDLVSNFRTAIMNRHPFVKYEDFRISLKLINYKDGNLLDFKDKKLYVNIPFVLKDIPYYRDTSSGPVKKEDIIDNIDFDETSNAINIGKLRETLFWKSFVNKNVEFVDKFNEPQQGLTKNYKSGMVAPVVLYEIPMALLCVGTQNEEVFNNDDRQLVCTFVDALAEYFRLERALYNMVKSQKVIVLDMSKDIALAIKNILEKKALLSHDKNNENQKGEEI